MDSCSLQRFLVTTSWQSNPVTIIAAGNSRCGRRCFVLVPYDRWRLLADMLTGSYNGVGFVQVATAATGRLISFSAVLASRQTLAKLCPTGFSTMIVIFAIDVATRTIFPIPKMYIGDWADPPGAELVLTSTPDNFVSIHRDNSFGFRCEAGNKKSP